MNKTESRQLEEETEIEGDIEYAPILAISSDDPFSREKKRERLKRLNVTLPYSPEDRSLRGT